MAANDRGEETRARIVAAAVSDFAQNGFDATGVAEICASAGVSKGAFYHHFESKQALYLELLDNWLTTIDEQLTSIRAQSDTALEALLEMTRVFRELFNNPGGEIPVFIEFLTKAAREPELRRAALAPYRRYQRYFAQIIEQGVEEGTIQTEDPDQAAQMLVAMATGLVLQGIIAPDAADWGTVAENGAAFFIRGMIGRR